MQGNLAALIIGLDGFRRLRRDWSSLDQDSLLPDDQLQSFAKGLHFWSGTCTYYGFKFGLNTTTAYSSDREQ
jgi:hypothetical protein